MTASFSDLLEKAEELAAATRFVLQGLRENAGGDAYEYVGSMNNVEWLRDALNDYEAIKIEE